MNTEDTPPVTTQAAISSWLSDALLDRRWVRRHALAAGPVRIDPPTAIANRQPASPVMWILASCSAATLAWSSKAKALARIAEISDAVADAKSGDVVLIAGIDIGMAVQASHELLARKIGVALSVESFPSLRGPMSIHKYGGEWVCLEPETAERPYHFMSRVIDVAAGAVAILIISPALAALMVAVRSTSPGPALFRSPRVGRRGEFFGLHKLRSMYSSSPSEDQRKDLYHEFMSEGSVLKVVDESRVTPIGRFLRRHSLDELPQFWNVIRGEISLVGPRPSLPYEYDLHEGWHHMRFRGRPGLTGLWQAYGRGRVTFEEMVLMDYCYSWCKSLLLDFRIVFRTAVVVITGEGGK